MKNIIYVLKNVFLKCVELFIDNCSISKISDPLLSDIALLFLCEYVEVLSGMEWLKAPPFMANKKIIVFNCG